MFTLSDHPPGQGPHQSTDGNRKIPLKTLSQTETGTIHYPSPPASQLAPRNPQEGFGYWWASSVSGTRQTNINWPFNRRRRFAMNSKLPWGEFNIHGNQLPFYLNYSDWWCTAALRSQNATRNHVQYPKWLPKYYCRGARQECCTINLFLNHYLAHHLIEKARWMSESFAR